MQILYLRRRLYLHLEWKKNQRKLAWIQLAIYFDKIIENETGIYPRNRELLLRNYWKCQPILFISGNLLNCVEQPPDWHIISVYRYHTYTV